MILLLILLVVILLITVKIYFIYFKTVEHNGIYNSTYVFVTSYFSIAKRKHSNKNYIEWMDNFFSVINKSLIIFTDNNSISYIPPNNGKYVVYNSIFDIPCVSKYKGIYLNQINLDPEKRLHSSELYAIWNAKICMLKKSTELYDKSVYIWIDIGSSRWKHSFKQFPDSEVIDFLSNLNSMFFFAVYNRKFKKEKYPKLILENFLEGTSFGGNKRSIIEYYDIFWKVHDIFLNKGQFIGKDQTIFNTIPIYYLQNITIFSSYGFYKCMEYNHWFRFYNYYAGYKCMINKGEKIDKYIY